LAPKGNTQILWEDGERVFRRQDDGRNVLTVRLSTEHPSPASLDRLAHEFGLRDELEGNWAVQPLALEREGGRITLILEDPGGDPLHRLLDAPLEVGKFLRLAISIAAALSRAHQRGLVHKDIKPAHILADQKSDTVRLTGFGIASHLPRERQAPEPPETIAGTLAYMAPEQTGRMNRSIDSRSDLYALGVTFYQMLTGSLPFTATDPMEWVHCHIARQPVPPAQRSESIPGPVSQIIMKLLAKSAEERYQTAAGVEGDLRHCLAQWKSDGRIDAFTLAERDMPGRLLIPETLYGRTREIATLLTAFDRVAKNAAPELVLISGYSGIGKSSVVSELHKVLVPPRGLFAAGKFDQYKRDIPYATLVQAFQSLVRPLLGKSETELAIWRSAFLEALEPNGRLMTDLIPELKLIIGEPPPVPELEPQQAQGRFQMVFRRFIGVFARPEHPLALFLDDLQWLDLATLDLLEDLLTRSELQNLMLIGAYRDNEVDAAHPLTRKLGAIRAAGAPVQEIRLAPLDRDDVGQLIADGLRCAPSHAAPLAQLVHEKTAGNPFFVIQFLQALTEEGLLHFNHDGPGWVWDLERIHNKGFTDNVVDLMVSKVTRLPAETQQALQLLACLGSNAPTAILSTILALPEARAHGALWPAVRYELVERRGDSYRFTHDRVQEAAYSLIPEASRAAAHLRIGRLLMAQTPPERREEAIFEIVNQLNRGAVLITEPTEREQLAELNLIAGKRAKRSTAYAAALTYLDAGAALLEDCGERQKLVFELDLNRAECDFLTGNLEQAEQRLSSLWSLATNLIDRAAVTCLRMDLYTTLDQSDRAVTVCLDYLRQAGGDSPLRPTEAEVRQEYARISHWLESHAVEDLADLPVMTDPVARATMDVLSRAMPPALFTNENIMCLLVLRAVNLSLDHGNCDASANAYVWFGQILGPYFGDYATALPFGQLAVDLVDRRGLVGSRAAVYLLFGNLIVPWTQPLPAGRQWLQRSFDAARGIGDITFAAYTYTSRLSNLLACGEKLAEVEDEATTGLEFARKAQFGQVINVIIAQRALVRMLRGLTRQFGCFDDGQFDELQTEHHFAKNANLGLSECWYWIRKLQARYLAGAYETALDAAAKAQRLLWTSYAFLEQAEYHFYAGLAHAASCDALPTEKRSLHQAALAVHYRQLEIWARHCPENFENRAALVGAEIARLEGRVLEAEQLYEQAIRSARDNGFVHNEAVANEVASRFYAARGFEKIARVYLQEARYGYLRWGADGKVRQLEELYPELRAEAPVRGSTSTIATAVEQLDLATVIKVSQAVSGEIVLEKLIDTLLRTAVEQAGAERGLLILCHGDEQRIAAEATTTGDTVSVHLGDRQVTATALLESVVYYVLRTHETIILDEAAAQPEFATDPYIRQHRTRSILCLPLLNQSKPIGALYLENNLMPGAFTPRRTAVLRLIASLAAVSLENTRLYRDLEQREARIRRLVDANIIGIFFFELEGRILEANDAFLRTVGYDRADLVAGHLRWTALTPPEWLERDLQHWLPEQKTTGLLQPFEKEYFRKDGSRVPVLIGVANLDHEKGVAFVLDLTERKQAEAEASESERRYREVQTELAHANRVATMGQLTASIAHEVNQPIAATVTNAQAALRWLAAAPPDLEEARQALAQIIKSSNRAGDVIGRIRTLIQKAVPQKDRLEINGTIREVIELTHGEATKIGVVVRTQLAEGLPLVEGDRVQLQQVILNLIINAIEAMSGMSEGPRDLLITTGITGSDNVLVAVADSGPGLPAAVDRLFEAFYTTKASGLGMGLSICHSIIEAHGGRLWANANQPRGAIFQFTLPTVPDL
jgi:PAS domain S-box-containing protein